MSRVRADRRANGWRAHVEAVHDANAGVTEEILTRSRDAHGFDPYAWVAQDICGDGPVVDVGCGSGPMAPHCRHWIGVDTSRPELHLATERGRQPVMLASSDRLPFDDGVVATVLAVMSLMVVDDPAASVREAARVLRPGGRLLVLLPAERPRTSADTLRYSALLAALGRRSLPFPHPDIARHLPGLLADHDLAITADETRRFAFPLRSGADADLLVRSLYLPGIAIWRRSAAPVALRCLGHGTLGIPLRRIVASRSASGRSRSR